MTDLNEHSTQLASATISKYFARFCPENAEQILKRSRALLGFVQTLKARGLGSFDSPITTMVMVGGSLLGRAQAFRLRLTINRRGASRCSISRLVEISISGAAGADSSSP